MRLTYKAEARVELWEAALYYERRETGLGTAFLDEVGRALNDLLLDPLRWRKSSGQFRRCLLKRFPYAIIYTVENDQVSLFAFAHLHRRPGYWRSRDRPPPPG